MGDTNIDIFVILRLYFKLASYSSEGLRRILEVEVNETISNLTVQNRCKSFTAVDLFFEVTAHLFVDFDTRERGGPDQQQWIISEDIELYYK